MILKLNSKFEKFDLILWLWSGMADFSPSEQKTSVKKLASYLSTNGKIIIDVLPNTITPLKTTKHSNQKINILNVDGSDIHIYSISVEEIEDYSKFVGLGDICHIGYLSSIKRQRIIYILS